MSMPPPSWIAVGAAVITGEHLHMHKALGGAYRTGVVDADPVARLHGQICSDAGIPPRLRFSGVTEVRFYVIGVRRKGDIGSPIGIGPIYPDYRRWIVIY